MGTAQVEFTEEELLADLTVAEPLIAGGVRCHGGFDDEGRYVSPRTKFRLPAITAWGEQNSARFSTELIDVPLEWWERSFPNVEQARFLIRAGVPEPLMATLTRIGTVEGFGANIRLLQPRDLQRHFVEDVGGTAIDHLGRGLFEAHGRDEAGWDEEAGHKDMWFAARDIAFDRSCEELDIEAMLARMGFGSGRPGADAARVLPDDIPAELEMMVSLMIRVLFIEISAFHTFAWAEEWMSDTELVARRRRGGPSRGVHQGRRVAPRRLPARRAHGDARPHLAGRGRAHLCRHRDDRADLGSRSSPTVSVRYGRRAGGRPWPRSSSGARSAPNGADILAEFQSLGPA